MKYLLICFSFLFILTTGKSQIHGTIIDEDQEPLPYINVLLLNAADSSFVVGTVSDEEGRFQLDQPSSEDFIVEVSGLGYQSWWSSSLTFDKEQLNKAFENIVMYRSTHDLATMEVTAQKMKIQQIPQGTIVNVQQSVMTRGSSALQVLERAPGVVVDRYNGGLALRGQNGVTIQINGKTLRMPPSTLLASLQAISADNIEKIELLTSPDATNDAEGTAGIINIITKENFTLGTSGSISVSAGYGWREKAGTSIQLQHSKPATSFSGGITYQYDQTQSDFRGVGDEVVPFIGGPVRFDFANRTRSSIHSCNLNFGVNHKLTKEQSIGLNVGYLPSVNFGDITNTALYQLQADSIFKVDINIDNQNRWENWDAGFFYENKLPKAGTLSVDVDYLSFRNSNPTTVQNNFYDSAGQSQPAGEGQWAGANRGSSLSDIKIGVGQFSFKQDLAAEYKLQTGVKLSYSAISNFGQIEQWQQDKWELDQRSYAVLDLQETLVAAYVTLAKRWTNQLSLDAGLRYELWNQDFLENTPDRQLSDFFPSLFLTYKQQEHKQWQLSFSKRITRPDYNDLATNLRYNGPISVFTGNPLLQPTISHQVSIGYQFKAYHFSLQWQNESNPIARYQAVANETSDLVLIGPQNVDYLRTFYLIGNFPIDVNNWWNLQVNTIVGPRSFRVSYPVVPKEKTYLGYDLSGSSTWQLPKNWSIELSGWYTSSHYNGSIRVDGFGVLNGGIKKQLSNGKGSIQLAIDDLLQSFTVHSYFGHLTEEAYKARGTVEYNAETGRNRIWRISYFRDFGSTTRQQPRRAATDEQNRVRKN